MVREDGRRSLGSIGSIGGQSDDLPLGKSEEDGKPNVTKLARILTVIAYIVSVSTAAALLSAYYIFIWVPHPSDPLNRPTDSPFSLAQHGNSHFAGGSFYHYPKNSYSNPVDATKHSAPSRGSKKSHHYKTTMSPNFLPKPQHLVRRKGSSKQTTSTPSPRTRY